MPVKILLDADATPVAVKEILYRAAERKKLPLTVVANSPIRVPQSDFISMVVVREGPDEADHEIVRRAEKGDLVISSNIPLADRVIEKGATVISFRGELLTASNIKERLSMRDFLEGLRNIEIQTGGPAPFSPKDRQKFANQLDTFLTKAMNP